ncbi:MAG TPA: ABC transporter ATP-binding protein [Bdellovibrionales bacterium]|mgnify:CR=1 FL=1|nr:ABC transporter ATP-binding protein [Bdellovibrionales bacterium]
MIEFREVRKSFGEREILKGITFSVPEGQILFILGTSGTGKSVLLKNIVGLLQPTSGAILIDEVDVSQLKEEQLFPIRKKCGMVFQHPALFDSLSVFENVAFGLRKHSPELTEKEVQARVRECLSLVHLIDVEDKMPQEISYGMQKRVSLARTVAVSPRILLFDEPTTGLDPVTTRAINRLIFELSRKLKTTSLVVSHDMQCALEIADHIIVLDKGEIVDQGSPEGLKKSRHELTKDFLKEALDAEGAH